MSDWMNQAGIKPAGRNINNLRYADDTTLMAGSKEELKNPLMGVKRGEWKSQVKTQHKEKKNLKTEVIGKDLNAWTDWR